MSLSVTSVKYKWAIEILKYEHWISPLSPVSLGWRNQEGEVLNLNLGTRLSINLKANTSICRHHKLYYYITNIQARTGSLCLLLSRVWSLAFKNSKCEDFQTYIGNHSQIYKICKQDNTLTVKGSHSFIFYKSITLPTYLLYEHLYK